MKLRTEQVVRFFTAPASPYPLGCFRIAVSLVAVTQVLVLWPYLLQLYGNFGFVQWAVVEADADAWLPSIGKLCLLLQPYGVSSSQCVYGTFILYLFSLCGLLLGCWTRPCAVAAWLVHSLTVNSGYVSIYGVDTIIHICLFYCAWMPVGDALSLKQLLRRRPVEPSFMAGLSLRALQLHLCIIYLNTGLAKAQGVQWWSGEAIWRATMQPQFAVFDMSWLASVPLLARLACWGVLLVELGYPLLIWPAKTRRFWVASTILLHLSIAVLMDLWMFSTIMIIMNFCAFGFNLLPALREHGPALPTEWWPRKASVVRITPEL
jgi:hypothetical protein